MTAKFSTIRNIFWPIHKHEAKIFFLMILLLSFLSISNSILRDMKILIPVNTPSNFITIFSHIIPILIYFITARRFTLEKIFYITIILFLLFFACFTAILQPLISVMGTRPLIIFHSFADMWTPIVLIILFWQFANSIYTVEQAKRIYPYLFFLSGISIIIPGIFMSFVKFDTTISIYAVVILGVFAIAVYYHINRNIEKKNNPKPEILLGKQQQNSIFQNIKNIATSPYLWLMIIILTTNDLENKEINLIFKNAIKNLYMDQSAYNEFMSYSNLLIGGCSISLFLPLMNIYRMAKWKTITRVGSIFVLIFIPILFACIWLGQNPSAHGIVGYTPTEILVYMTLILKILLVATSGFFFINLQIAFIPLAPTDKQNGQVFVQMLSNLFLFLISVFFVYLNQNHINKNFFTSENSLIFLTILALLSIFAISRLSKRFEQSKKFS